MTYIVEAWSTGWAVLTFETRRLIEVHKIKREALAHAATLNGKG